MAEGPFADQLHQAAAALLGGEEVDKTTLEGELIHLAVDHVRNWLDGGPEDTWGVMADCFGFTYYLSDEDQDILIKAALAFVTRPPSAKSAGKH
jgi:hypothetical protein